MEWFAKIESAKEGGNITEPGHTLQRVWQKICPLSWSFRSLYPAFHIRVKGIWQYSGFLCPLNFAATGLLCLLLALIVPTAAQSQTTPNAFWNFASASMIEGTADGLPFQLTQTTTAAANLTITVGGTATHGTDYTFGDVRYANVNGSPVTNANGASYANGTLTVAIPSGTTRFTQIWIDIATVDDSVSDPTETIIMTVDPTSSFGAGSPSSVTVTVGENSGVATYVLSGDPHVGEVLTLTRTEDDPDGGVQTEAFEWRVPRDGASDFLINGATGTTWTADTTRETFLVKVNVTYTDGNGVIHDVESNTLGPIGSARPKVVSIVRQGASPTNADSLIWRVLFNEPVKDVDAADFSLSGSTAMLSVVPATGVNNAYDVTASGGNLAGLNGMVTLSFASNQNIKDANDVALIARDTTPSGTNEPTYEVTNAPGVTLTTTDGSTVVSEDGSTTTDTYALVLNSIPTHDVTLTVTAGSGVQVSVDGGTNYAASRTLTFTSGNSSTAQTITVQGVDDGVDNPSGERDVAITHTTTSTDSRYNNLSVDSVDVRVTDDDATTVTLAGAAGDINEGQTKTMTLTLGRGLVTGESLTVPLTFGGTATRNTDYTMTGTVADGVQYNNLNSGSANVVFTGPTSGTTAMTATITLSAAADSSVESTAETVIIGLGALTNTGLTNAGGVDATDSLADFNISDPPQTTLPNAFWRFSTRSFIEGTNGSIAVRVTQNISRATDMTFTVGGTATHGTDYTFGTGVSYENGFATFTIPAGTQRNTSVPFLIKFVDDNVSDNGETVRLTIDSTNSLGRGDPYQLEITILEDSGSATYVISGDPRVGEVLTVIRTEDDPDGIQTEAIEWRKQNSEGSEVLTPDGTSGKSLTLTEAELGFQIGVFVRYTDGSGNQYTDFANPFLTDPVRPIGSARPGVSIIETSGATVVSEDGSTTTDSYTLVLNSAPTEDVTVTVSAGSGVEVSADGGTNYAGSRTLTFTSGNWDTAQTITVRGVDDNVDNPGGGRNVAITHATSSTDSIYNNRSVDSVDVRVTDDDATTVVLAGEAGNINEGRTKTMTLTLGRGLVDGEVLTVPLTFGGTATRGTDYTLRSTTATGVQYNSLNSGSASVVFTGPQTGATATTATITLTATTDSSVESPVETVIVGLGTLTNTGLTNAGGVDATDSLADFSISDPSSVSVSESSVTVADNDATATYTVVLTSQPSGNVVISATSGATTTATVAPGTLTFTNSDWNTPQTVTITGKGAGSTSITHEVTTTGDTTNYPTSTTIPAVSVTVTTPGVTVSPTSLALTELGDPTDVTKTYTIALSTDPGADVTITVANGDATAVAVDTDAGTSGDQNTLTFTHGNNGNWNTAQTVTVRALNDGDGANESFNITHTATATGSTAPYDGITIDPVTITTADAGHGVVVSEASVTVADNDETTTYTLVLKSQPSGNVVISATSGGTAQTVKFRALNDGDGAHESFNITYAATSGGTGTVTVAPPSLTFTNSDWNIPQTVTITVKEAGSTSISHAVTTTGDATNYPTTMTISSVTVTVTPTVPPGVTLTESGGSTEVKEDGSTTDSYDLVLATKPADDVTLTVSAGRGVEVSTDGGSSYASSQTVTFTRSGAGLWSAAQTITVRGVEDGVDHAGTVTISHATSSTDPRYNNLSVASVAVRVTDVMDKRLTTALRATAAGLIRFGRTVGQQVVDAVRDRVGADRTQGLKSRLAGEPLPLIAEPSESSESSGRPNQEYVRPHRFDHDPHQSDGFGRENDTDVIRALSDEDALRGTAFTLTTMGEEGSSFAFWGEGSISQFRGTDDGLSLEGEVRDIMLGADRSWSDHLVGALVMGSRGEITYSMGDDTGRLDTSLTSLVPYGGWHARNGLTYWGAAGIGRGTMTVTPEGEDPFEGPIDWHMVSGGVEGSLSGVSLLPEARLVWHSDVLWTRTTSEPVGDLPSLGGETTRLRLGVDATWPERSLLDGFVTPEVGMGIRYDGGDAETGFGLEVHSGLRWRDPQSHLELSLTGRTLAVHDDGAFKDWGVRFGVFWDPHPTTKEGISAAFSYDLGDGAVDGDALLGPAVFPDQRANEGATSWQSEVAYGVSRGGGMVGSPYGGIGGTSAAIDEARVGYRIEPDTPHAENMHVDVWTDLVAENEEQSAGAGLTWSW